MRLGNKVALITGGGSGLGRASAVLFAAEGAMVVVSDQNEDAAKETADSILSDGGDATVVGGDVSINADAQRMVKTAVEAYGKLDVLVNSAGISMRNVRDPNASHEMVWDRVMDVNIKGTYLVCWYSVPEMERAGGGSIINLASIMGLVGIPYGTGGGGFNPYTASKGAVVNFTRNLAIDCASKNIRVNCICPGYVYTNLIESMIRDSELLKTLEGRHPMGRLGRPEEIAYAALYLASDESSFVTGTPLVVDGGYTAQ